MTSQVQTPISAGQGFYTGSGPGSTSWTNPGNFTSPSSLAVYTGTSSSISKSLDAYDFPFTVPGGATFNGFQFQASAYYATHPGSLKGCKLTLGGNLYTPATTNQFNATTLTSSAANYDAGGASDLWGATSDWNTTNVNSGSQSGMCFSCWVAGNSSSLVATINVNSAQGTIYYTAAATTAHAAAAIPVPFVFLSGAWIPFTLAIARELLATFPKGTQFLFKQTVSPRRVTSGWWPVASCGLQQSRLSNRRNLRNLRIPLLSRVRLGA